MARPGELGAHDLMFGAAEQQIQDVPVVREVARIEAKASTIASRLASAFDRPVYPSPGSVRHY